MPLGLLGKAIIAFFILIVSMTFAAAQSRFALVIANSNYPNKVLPTTHADGALVAETMRAAGYDVTEFRDVRLADIGLVIRDFLDKVAAGGSQAVAFVYFAGYAAQSGGENYLVPVDAQIASDGDVALQALRVNDVIRELAALPAAARLLVLDAARDHGFGRGASRPVPQGLALMDVPAGMLIASSAAPGAIAIDGDGANSLYTGSLVTMMRQPGLDMEQIFKGTRLYVNQATGGAQTPWMVSALGVELRLFDAPAAAAPPPAVSGIAIPPKGERVVTKDMLGRLSADEAYQIVIEEDSLEAYQWFVELFPHHQFARQIWDIIEQRREAVLWRRTLAQNTIRAYWNYLARYPNGAHAAEAEERLARLQASRRPPPNYVPVPDPLPPGYYDEAIGLVEVFPLGILPPPLVFGVLPPLFLPPPRIVVVPPIRVRPPPPPPPPPPFVDPRRPPPIAARPPGVRPPPGARPPGAPPAIPPAGARPPAAPPTIPPTGARPPGAPPAIPPAGARPPAAPPTIPPTGVRPPATPPTPAAPTVPPSGVRPPSPPAIPAAPPTGVRPPTPAMPSVPPTGVRPPPTATQRPGLPPPTGVRPPTPPSTGVRPPPAASQRPGLPPPAPPRMTAPPRPSVSPPRVSAPPARPAPAVSAPSARPAAQPPRVSAPPAPTKTPGQVR